MSEALLERLDRLESRVDIEALASNYCHGFDKRDEALFMSIWSDDCIWNIGPPFGSFEGSAGVHHALIDILWPAWGISQHVTSNLVINLSIMIMQHRDVMSIVLGRLQIRARPPS
jgi:hypothetical protein